MIAEEFEKQYRALPSYFDIKNKKLREEQKEANRIEEQKIDEAFKDALKEEYGQNLSNAGHEFLWEAAWSDGHYAGYTEVEQQYEMKLYFFEQMTEANNK